MIEIKNDFLSIGVLPEIGGAFSYLKYHNTDILRPTKLTETNVNQTSLFPMIPYASFIQDGHFPYFGITRFVPKNCDFSKYPLHGDVWHSKLDILNYDSTHVSLSYHHDKNQGFPFSYSAQLEYRINQNNLQIIETIENTSILPMPYGMGIHPFFKRDADTVVYFEADKIWYRGDDPILGHPYTAPAHLNFKNGLPVPGNGINISFGSWNRTASIVYPTQKIKVDIMADSVFRHLILFAPKGKDFFCLEPVTNTPDAFNLASLGIVGTGIQSLGPHQTVSQKIEFILKGLK